jgi:ligand-binding SRPBCC domain-containing protein
MKLYCLHRTQHLPIQISEAWSFFSDPRNLAIITPSWLDFKMTCEAPEKIYAGLIVTYRIRPFLRVPVTWITEITHVRAPHFFVDEQRFGPYRFWHHQHVFREADGGVEMEDLVHYALPYGALGTVINELLVQARLNEIFDFRRQTLARTFSSKFTAVPASTRAPDFRSAPIESS